MTFASFIRPLAVAASLLANLASAQTPPATLSQTPAPGLWEHEYRLYLNGQDVTPIAQLAQANALAQLTPEQRREWEARLPPGQGGAGRVRHCLTAEQATSMKDPEQALAQAMKQTTALQQRCSARVRDVVKDGAGDRVAFVGRCNDPNSFTGDYRGTLTLADANRWRFAMQGRGEFAPSLLAQVPLAAALLIGPVDMQTVGEGRWIAADCGNVPPVR